MGANRWPVKRGLASGKRGWWGGGHSAHREPGAGGRPCPDTRCPHGGVLTRVPLPPGPPAPGTPQPLLAWLLLPLLAFLLFLLLAAYFFR